MWLIFVIIDMIICGFLDIIEKKGSKDQPLQFWAIAVFLYGIFNTILGVILLPKIVMNFEFKSFLLILPISLLSTIGYYCSVQAFKHSDISIVSPIMRTKIIWVLILSSIFLRSDRLSYFQIILIFILLVLNIVLTKEKKTKKNKIGILFALGFVLSNGTATFINKVAINLIQDPISVTFYSGITSVFSIIVILLIFKDLKLLNFAKFKNKKQAIFMELLEVIGMLIIRYALINGNIVIITAMTSSSIIITIILSNILLKEKINLKKWSIILLIVLCLVLLSIISI